MKSPNALVPLSGDNVAACRTAPLGTMDSVWTQLYLSRESVIVWDKCMWTKLLF